jgi:hypothetical protein
MGVEFDSSNQPKNRPPRGKGKKALMLDAIRKVSGTEEEYLQEVVKASVGGWRREENAEAVFIPPNPQLLSLVLNRIEPPLKSINPMVNFEFDKNSKPHEQAGYVLSAIAGGEIPSDIGNIFIQSIKAMIDIEEYTTLKERIAKIEKSLGLTSE